MRFVLLSDLHGNLPKSLPDGDFLIIAGDISEFDGDLNFHVAWFNEKFIPWISQFPHRHKIFIAGNHDFIFEKRREELKINNCVYLQDESVILDGIKIHGSPWSAKFGAWAFMEEDDKLNKVWESIDTDVDVLVVHGPPFGILDKVYSYYRQMEHNVGSKSLLYKLPSLSQLKLCVFGHIHEGYGRIEIDNINFINASHCDGDMNPTNKPQIFDL